MANLTINSLTFISRNLAKLKELHSVLTEVADSTTKNSICELMAKHGYNANTISNLCARRDYISDIDQVIHKKDKSYYLHAEIVSAWEPHLAPIKTLLIERYNSEIKLISQSIEEGEGLFYTNDWTGMFYPEKFMVDLCTNESYDTQYLESWTELIAYLENAFEEADISPLDSIDELISAIEDKYQDGDDSFFINIHAFTPYPEEDQFYTILRKEAA